MDATSATSANQAPRLNRAELAKHHGVAKTTVDRWIDRGCPYVTRGVGPGSQWLFDPAAVIKWRLDEQAKEVASRFAKAGTQNTKEDADLRRAQAAAALAEIDLDERLGRVVAVSDAAEATSSFVQVIKTGLGNASAKIAGRASTMTSPAEIQAMVEAELNRAFQTARAEYEMKWSNVVRSAGDAGAKGRAA